MKTTFPKQGSPRPESTGAEVLEIAQISPAVEDVLAATPFIDIHTHLFAPSFGKLGLWGIDELITYHYLEAEFFRSSHTKPEQYFALPKDRSEEHTSELQSLTNLVCRLLPEKTTQATRT